MRKKAGLSKAAGVVLGVVAMLGGCTSALPDKPARRAAAVQVQAARPAISECCAYDRDSKLMALWCPRAGEIVYVPHSASVQRRCDRAPVSTVVGS
ncbi:MAG: hypothetical protein H6707_02340 [Deltaproteobacteria bacterium]|nr:hypothetical protein [Deltaproteobacteria bacterium]